MFLMQVDVVDVIAPVLDPECAGKTGYVGL